MRTQDVGDRLGDFRIAPLAGAEQFGFDLLGDRLDVGRALGRFLGGVLFRVRGNGAAERDHAVLDGDSDVGFVDPWVPL